MKRLLALLLTLVLVMSLFAACDSGRDKDDDDDDEGTSEDDKPITDDNSNEDFDIEGDWTTVINFADLLGLDVEANIRCTITFADGNYTMAMNEDDLSGLADAIIGMVNDMAAAENSTFEEYTGMTEEDYRTNWADSMVETSTSGEYNFDGETLIIDDVDNELEIVNNNKIIITDSGISMELTRA